MVNAGIDRRALLLTLFAMTAVIAGCESIDQADGDIGRIAGIAQAKSAQLHDAQRGNVIEEAAPYYGEAVKRPSVAANKGRALPRKLQASAGVELRLSQPADISRIAKSIQDATGLPVRIRRRFADGNGADNDVSSGN